MKSFNCWYLVVYVYLSVYLVAVEGLQFIYSSFSLLGGFL